MSIVFAGDFHQSKTMSGSPIYDAWLIQWHGSINCSTMLEGSHRFADDPEWGETLKRAQNGTDTVEDREKINERWLHLEGIALPTEGDICYACPFNRGRNAINATIFRNHIEATHPKVSDQTGIIPDHTLIIEASFYHRAGKKKCSKLLHETVYEHCGDANITTSHNKRIDPAIRFWKGAPFMINSNENLSKGLGNGTLVRGLQVKLKSDAELLWKNWDGYKVNTVSIEDVEYVLCEYCDDSKKKFKLKPEKNGSVAISLNMFNNTHKIGGIQMIQFGIVSNVATTGHKLQGMSKDNLIVESWNYSFDNWIYVVLSRVRTRSGLFICEKLDLTKPFTVDPKIVEEENRLATLEEKVLSRWRQNQTQ